MFALRLLLPHCGGLGRSRGVLQGLHDPVDLGAPRTPCARIPEEKALVGAVAPGAWSQALGKERAEYAIRGVLNHENARPGFGNLSVHRPQRDAVHRHAVAQVPTRLDLQERRQVRHDARDKVAARVRQDDGGATVDPSTAPLGALHDQLRHLPARDLGGSESLDEALVRVLAVGQLLARGRQRHVVGRPLGAQLDVFILLLLPADLGNASACQPVSESARAAIDVRQLRELVPSPS
mmetsp:Transcript_19568/g.54723  ORF Transcript_19568/g.54723 Transcript_19568/m.54723 type:complete len:237 (-) Transcript_19568:94-804(-)